MNRYDDEKWFATDWNTVVRKCVDPYKLKMGDVANCGNKSLAKFIALAPTIAYALGEVIAAYDSGSITDRFQDTYHEDNSITYARKILRAAWNTDGLPYWNPTKTEWEFK